MDGSLHKAICWMDGGQTKNEGAKISLKSYILSVALKMSVTYLYLYLILGLKTSLNWLTHVYELTSTCLPHKCVTGNNVTLHEGLLGGY